jgi:electron transfer flavoprotein alpha/beta subunit
MGSNQQIVNPMKVEAHNETKTTIEQECEAKRVALDPRVPNITVLIVQEISSEEEAEMLSFLDKNNDVFTWSTLDLTGIRRNIIERKLYVNPSAKPKKKRLHKMSEGKITAAKVEAQRLLDAGFIREVEYPT